MENIFPLSLCTFILKIMQSVPITTDVVSSNLDQDVVSSNLDQGEVYNIM
jgi:hypothetical protein